MNNPKHKRKKLHSLLKQTGVLLPGTYNALTAKLIEKEGFKGAYISGGALHASAGLTDTGKLSLSDMSFFAKFITQSVTIPCICDADTGFGDIESTVKSYETLGLAGLHIEDQTFPKRCGHLQGKELVSSEEMCKRIQQATKARSDKHFLIIARTDARSVEGLENTLKRAKEYIHAGADMIFPEALPTKQEFETVANTLSIPLMANITEFGTSPLLSVNDLKSIGYTLIIFPVSTLRLSAKKTETFLKSIKKSGSQIEFLNNMQTRKELYELLDYKGTVHKE